MPFSRQLESKSGGQWFLEGVMNQDCAPFTNGYDFRMTALEQIHQMPFHEKLLVMEALWDDLSRNEDALEVPQWHKDILDERDRLVAEGKAQFIDWEEAKKQIKEALI